MSKEELMISANYVRYNPDNKGHYESFFIRANHPQKPIAARYAKYHLSACKKS